MGTPTLLFYCTGRKVFDKIYKNMIKKEKTPICAMKHHRKGHFITCYLPISGKTPMLHSDTKRIYGLFKVIYKCSTVKEQIGHSVLQPILMSTEQTPVFFAAPKYPAMLSKLAKGRTESYGDSARGPTWQSHEQRFPAALQ